jgi:hypothetical protein
MNKSESDKIHTNQWKIANDIRSECNEMCYFDLVTKKWRKKNLCNQSVFNFL